MKSVASLNNQIIQTIKRVQQDEYRDLTVMIENIVSLFSVLHFPAFTYIHNDFTQNLKILINVSHPIVE